MFRIRHSFESGHTPGAPGDSDDDINGGEGNYDPDAPNGGVSGRICAPSQNVYVADAEVYIEFEDGTRLSTQTDADGYFTLEGVPVGTYTVHVEKGSFGATFDVTITEGTITELAQDECLEGDIEIAVVTGSYDDVGGILTRLGLSYDAYDGDPYGSREYEELSPIRVVWRNMTLSFLTAAWTTHGRMDLAVYP